MKSERNATVEEVSTQGNVAFNEELIKSVEEIQAYNASITNHLPCYSTFVPTQNVLIRIFRRLPVITKGGLILNIPENTDFAKVMKTAGTGQEYSLKEVAAEFRFTNRAVIVAVPEYAVEKYPVGKEVIIEFIVNKITKIEDTTYYDYGGSFIHPSSNRVAPPSDCTDEHYGYALIPISFIRGWNN